MRDILGRRCRDCRYFFHSSAPSTPPWLGYCVLHGRFARSDDKPCSRFSPLEEVVRIE